MPSAAAADQRYQDVRKVTLIGAVINVVLAVLKVFAGIVGQSHALIADGLHSFSDLVSDALVVYAAKHGSRVADEQHPYGHQRIETAFTVALGGLLILVALGVVADAGRRLMSPDMLMHPTPLALIFAAVSILAKEWLYHFTKRTAKKLNSRILHANAWHHRSDAISSIVVLVGVAGSLMGLDYLDAFASLGVAAMIAGIGWNLAWGALRELVDTGLDPERVSLIHSHISEIQGVLAVHQLRSRSMGGEAYVDVHVQVDPRISVSEGHQIGELVRIRLLDDVDEVADVTVHIDPEDDETEAENPEELPNRSQILSYLQESWKDILAPEDLLGVQLHYLGGKVFVDALLSLSLLTDTQHADGLRERLRGEINRNKAIGGVHIRFS